VKKKPFYGTVYNLETVTHLYSIGLGVIVHNCNETKRLPPELLDRFQVIKFKPYTKDEFRKITVGYLTKRLGLKQDLAEYIAEKVGAYSTSVREAIRLSRLAKTKEEVDKITEITRKYRLPF